MRHSVLSKIAREPSAFAEDVERSLSLTPRQLPSRYLYDDLGSALFEAICRLPWYRITRTEQRLLQVHARDIFGHTGLLSTLVELGPGNGEKLTTLLSAGGRPALTVHLVDVSRQALDSATRMLETFPDLAIVGHEATYEVGLAEATRQTRASGRTLTLCLGSNIGNFDPPYAHTFLRAIRTSLTRGDSLLLGVDLVKPESELLLAYDDPLGVTAAFNRNLLVRANRELDANFDLAHFAHRAIWNARDSRVEMQLVSTREQRVLIPAAHLDIQFHAGETIWTESSYKYRPDDLDLLLDRAGFGITARWTADGFALTLAAAR
jgi:dimethylhistidine N-methyltransferase